MSKRSGTPKHVHKFIHTGPVWKCAFPSCSFFVYEKQGHVIEGRASFCWECGKNFVIDLDAMSENMPRCFDCRNPQLHPVLQQLQQVESDKPLISQEEFNKRMNEMLGLDK